MNWKAETMETAYKFILEETSEWNTALKSALANYEKHFKEGKHSNNATNSD